MFSAEDDAQNEDHLIEQRRRAVHAHLANQEEHPSQEDVSQGSTRINAASKKFVSEKRKREKRSKDHRKAAGNYFIHIIFSVRKFYFLTSGPLSKRNFKCFRIVIYM